MFKRFMKPYRVEAVLGPLFKLFEATLELIVPLVIALIIDNGINGNGGVGEAGVVLLLNLLELSLETTQLVLAGLDIGLDFCKLLLQGGFGIEALVELGVELLHVDGSNLDVGLSRGSESAQRHEGGGDEGELHNV